jgi:hypothetical protein
MFCQESTPSAYNPNGWENWPSNGNLFDFLCKGMAYIRIEDIPIIVTATRAWQRCPTLTEQVGYTLLMLGRHCPI